MYHTRFTRRTVVPIGPGERPHAIRSHRIIELDFEPQIMTLTTPRPVAATVVIAAASLFPSVTGRADSQAADLQDAGPEHLVATRGGFVRKVIHIRPAQLMGLLSVLFVPRGTADAVPRGIF